MKRTLTALALVVASLAAPAHADRESQANLRCTEAMIPMMSAAARMGESDEQISLETIKIRADLMVVFGQLYDLGYLLRERNQPDPEAKLRSVMLEKIKLEDWAQDLNETEQAMLINAMVKAVEDGYHVE
ncbi:hypothetical protein VPZ60_004297 [Salmonella enterica]|nr:hypothetical protein [Salmonella enterica]